MPSDAFLRRMRERVEPEMHPGRLLEEAGNLWVVLEVCEAGCHVILRSVAQPNNPNRPPLGPGGSLP